MQRREFIRVLGGTGIYVIAGSQFFLSGCSSDGGDGGNILSPFEEWNPEVNDEPYPRPDFSYAKDISDQRGNVSFSDESDGKIYSYFFSDNSGNAISGIEAVLNKEYRFGEHTGALVARDSRGRFMPEVISLKDASKLVSMTRYEDSYLRCSVLGGTNFCSLGQEADFFLQGNNASPNIFIDNVIGPLPEYSAEKMDDLPGHVYLGDWSFESLKNLNTTLKYGSLAGGVVLTFLTGGAAAPVVAKTYAVFENTGRVLDLLDNVIDGINLVNRREHGDNLINKNQIYSIYTPLSGNPHMIFFPQFMGSRSLEFDIKDLLPVNKGNSWTYSDGRQTATSRILGTRKIKGRNFFVARSADGLEEYFGYYGKELRYFGMNFPGIGNLFFDPAITIGDDKIRIGKRFQNNNVRLISEQHPEVSGDFSLGIIYGETENVKTRSNVPFGDCFHSKELWQINVSGPGGSESESFEAESWFAKGLGRVRLNFNGSQMDLVNSNLNSRMQGFTFPPFSAFYAETSKVPSFSRKIAEAYLKVR